MLLLSLPLRTPLRDVQHCSYYCVRCNPPQQGQPAAEVGDTITETDFVERMTHMGGTRVIVKSPCYSLSKTAPE